MATDAKVKAAVTAVKQAAAKLTQVRVAQKVVNAAIRSWSKKTANIAQAGGTTQVRWDRLQSRYDELVSALKKLAVAEEAALSAVARAHSKLAKLITRTQERHQ